MVTLLEREKYKNFYKCSFFIWMLCIINSWWCNFLDKTSFKRRTGTSFRWVFENLQTSWSWRRTEIDKDYEGWCSNLQLYLSFVDDIYILVFWTLWSVLDYLGGNKSSFFYVLALKYSVISPEGITNMPFKSKKKSDGYF